MSAIPMISPEDYHRIYWHSRRGMLELDLILMPFVEKHFRQLSAAEQQDYIRLLTCEDQDLFGWFLQHKQPEDAGLAATVTLILQKHLQGH